MSPTLGSRINSVAVHVGRALRTGTVGHDLAIEHRSALSVIAFTGPIRLGALAVAEQVTAPAITRTVGILEARGLVRRVPDPDDRRATLIVATASGSRMVRRGRDERARKIDDALRHLTPASVRRIGDAIEDLEALVHMLAAERASTGERSAPHSSRSRPDRTGTS